MQTGEFVLSIRYPFVVTYDSGRAKFHIYVKEALVFVLLSHWIYKGNCCDPPNQPFTLTTSTTQNWGQWFFRRNNYAYVLRC